MLGGFHILDITSFKISGTELKLHSGIMIHTPPPVPPPEYGCPESKKSNASLLQPIPEFGGLKKMREEAQAAAAGGGRQEFATFTKQFSKI